MTDIKYDGRRRDKTIKRLFINNTLFKHMSEQNAYTLRFFLRSTPVC